MGIGAGSSPLDNEHSDLLEVAEDLIVRLEAIPESLRPARISYMHHMTCAERCTSLALYLRDALSSCREVRYPAAFATLRSAMEHQLIDRLLFQGTRFKREFSSIDETTWSRMQAARRAGESWTENILEARRTRRGAYIIYRGVNVASEDSSKKYTVSILHGFLEQHDPFWGRPGDQELLTRDGLTAKEAARIAKEQRNIYEQGLKWPSIKSSLLINRFFTEKQLSQLEVHYRFLSAYVHPSLEAIRMAYPRGMWRGAVEPTYDHYSSELVLLYAIKFAANQLKSFRRMTRRTPRVGLQDWEVTSKALDVADAMTSHLWFPGDKPHEYDRILEANQRAWGKRKRPVPIKSDRNVRYYRNPLQRLIGLHLSTNEMVGFSYRSPWPRADATFRL